MDCGMHHCMQPSGVQVARPQENRRRVRGRSLRRANPLCAYEGVCAPGCQALQATSLRHTRPPVYLVYICVPDYPSGAHPTRCMLHLCRQIMLDKRSLAPGLGTHAKNLGYQIQSLDEPCDQPVELPPGLVELTQNVK